MQSVLCMQYITLERPSRVCFCKDYLFLTLLKNVDCGTYWNCLNKAFPARQQSFFGAYTRKLTNIFIKKMLYIKPQKKALYCIDILMSLRNFDLHFQESIKEKKNTE